MIPDMWNMTDSSEVEYRQPIHQRISLEWYPFYNTKHKRMNISPRRLRIGLPETWRHLCRSSGDAFLSKNLLNNPHVWRFRVFRAQWNQQTCSCMRRFQERANYNGSSTCKVRGLRYHSWCGQQGVKSPQSFWDWRMPSLGSWFSGSEWKLGRCIHLDDPTDVGWCPLFKLWSPELWSHWLATS